MSFRKRHVGVADSRKEIERSEPHVTRRTQLPGVRSSPVDGRPTTSTGTSTLDNLLAGHAGLALGSSILLEESGTTDYAGALLRFYAAEGLVQGHHLHIIGLPERWGRELPGLVGDSDQKEKTEAKEKMKIAWRYERLGQFELESPSRERTSSQPDKELHPSQLTPQTAFCHMFDLTKRLTHPASSHLSFIQLQTHPSKSPFGSIIQDLKVKLESSNPDTVHRLVVPSLLSPALYPVEACMPQNVVEFLHGIRALLTAHHGRLTAMMSLPLSLHPRSSGIVRWMELLSDGVIELDPFPHSAEAESQALRGPETPDEPPQGLLKIHRLPIVHERGSGTGLAENDWTFALSRRRFNIKPFNLPPIEGDSQAQQVGGDETKGKKADMNF